MQNDEKFSLVLIALVFTAAIAIQLFTLPYFDLVWLTLGTRQMLHGAVLYKDVLEPNPPLIFWLYAPVVRLAEIFSLEPVILLKMATIMLVALTLILATIILHVSDLWRKDQRNSLLVAISALLLLSPHSEMTFSQREHLMVILVLPYVLMCLPSIRSQELSLSLQFICGVMAGVGFCIKPYFLIIWIGLLLSRLVTHRSLRAVFGCSEMVVIACGAAYFCAILIFAPNYLPWAQVMLQTYPYFTVGQTEAEKIAELILVGIASLLIAWKFGIFTIKQTTCRKDALLFVYLALASYVCILLQFKTWLYLYYPLMTFGMLSIITLIICQHITGFFSLAVMAILFYPAAVTSSTDNQQSAYIQEYHDMQSMIAPYSHANSFYLVRHASAPPQLYRFDPPLMWSSRFNYMDFVLMGALEVSPISHRVTLRVRPGKEALERWISDIMAEDLETKKPALLIVEKDQYKKDVPEADKFDFLRWFEHSPRLIRVMQEYRLEKETAICATQRHCYYYIFLRK